MKLKQFVVPSLQFGKRRTTTGTHWYTYSTAWTTNPKVSVVSRGPVLGVSHNVTSAPRDSEHKGDETFTQVQHRMLDNYRASSMRYRKYCPRNWDVQSVSHGMVPTIQSNKSKHIRTATKRSQSSPRTRALVSYSNPRSPVCARAARTTPNHRLPACKRILIHLRFPRPRTVPPLTSTCPRLIPIPRWLIRIVRRRWRPRRRYPVVIRCWAWLIWRRRLYVAARVGWRVMCGHHTTCWGTSAPSVEDAGRVEYLAVEPKRDAGKHGSEDWWCVVQCASRVFRIDFEVLGG